MFPEAINTLLVLVKNKAFDRAGRLRVNIGNIHFKQQKYLQAVKQYRMALDQIPSVEQDLRSVVQKGKARQGKGSALCYVASLYVCVSPPLSRSVCVVCFVSCAVCRVLLYRVGARVQTPTPALCTCDRSAVLKNIGQAFIKMGQYGDAMKTFEHVLEETPTRVRGRCR